MNKLKMLLVSAAAAVSLGAFAANKYALVVGVDKYDEKYEGGSKMEGAQADVRNMTNVLVRYGGWPAESVVVLRDEKATVANVSAAFGDLAARIQSGDSFVFYWSAHGDYRYSPEEDKESACVCAHDADYTPAMMAKDLERLPSGTKAVVVIDTCCSGAMMQMANVGSNAKAAAPTFAQRVDALLSRSKAGGIAASEVGWMSSAAYNQTTGDDADGGEYMVNCLAQDGVYWGKADTDGDGDISFLDLHNHARKWFSEGATFARKVAICGKLSDEDAVATTNEVKMVSPQMMHAEVLASVLARDHAVAGGNKYPFKVEFHLVCNNQEVSANDAEGSAGKVQFVWAGESAEEPKLKFKWKVDEENYSFERWEEKFDNVQKDLIVHGTCVEVREADIETFAEVAARVKKFVGFALAECTDPQTSNAYQYVAAAFDGSYAKGGKLTVTLTDVDGTKTKFTGELDDVSVDGFFLAELTSAKSDDTIAIKMDASSVGGTYCHDGVEYPILGNWDWLATHDTVAQAVRERFAAVYNVGMSVDFFFGERKQLPTVGGYVNVTVSEKDGKAKVAGMLGDGTKISVTTKAVVLSTLKQALDGVVYVPIVLARTNKRSGFSGLLTLGTTSKGGRAADFGSGLDNYGKTRAYWDNSAQGEATAYQAYLNGNGSEFIAAEMPETASTDVPTPGDVTPLYVKVGGQVVEFACETNALPSGYALAYANGKFTVTDPKSDDTKLKLTLNNRTGVLSGSFRVWYADDPDDPSVEKYATATVYGGWATHDNKAQAFGLVTDTHPDRAKLKLKTPIELVVMGPSASDEPSDDGTDED